jgi:monofunctional biosynthetic peptidoglycan transglycosylase
LKGGFFGLPYFKGPVQDSLQPRAACCNRHELRVNSAAADNYADEKEQNMHKAICFIIITALAALPWACSPTGDKHTVKRDIQPSAGGAQWVLFDFGATATAKEWRSVNDTVMGGVSSSQMLQNDDGDALFTGTVSLDNNGGFASVRSPSIKAPLGQFTGIAARVRGDGKTYKVGLRTDDMFDGVFHQASFSSLAGQWQVINIAFADFVPTYHGRRLSDDKRMSPADIRSVSFLIADKQKGPFRLEIDWIKAYR